MSEWSQASIIGSLVACFVLTLAVSSAWLRRRRGDRLGWRLWLSLGLAAIAFVASGIAWAAGPGTATWLNLLLVASVCSLTALLTDKNHCIDPLIPLLRRFATGRGRDQERARGQEPRATRIVWMIDRWLAILVVILLCSLFYVINC